MYSIHNRTIIGILPAEYIHVSVPDQQQQTVSGMV